MKPDTTSPNPLQAEIDAEAESIRKKIEGGMLYGYPIDMTNANQVLYAAWLIAQLKQTGAWRPIL